MNWFKKNILILGIIILASVRLTAVTFNVPRDIDTIQGAINEAESGDTVLVHPGVYHESISLIEEEIVVGSLFLVTGNSEYITSTILNGDGCRRQVYIYNVGENGVLCGMTIYNGHDDYGGGIMINGSHIHIRNLLVRQNNAERFGGGIYCIGGGSPMIDSVTFDRNLAVYGGGIACVEGTSPIISNSIFFNNRGSYYGGGIYVNNSSPLIINSTIQENNADRWGGGIYCTNGASPIIRETVFTGNYAGTGGVIGCYRGADVYLEKVIIYQSNVDCSKILCSGASISIAKSLICSYRGYALHLIGDGSARLDQVTITNNGSRDCHGGICRARYESITIHNSIIWPNRNDLYRFGAREMDISYTNLNDAEYYNRQGIGRENIDEDPDFINADEGSFYLEADSPCIDTGDPDSPLEPDSTRADMGVYPYYHHPVLYGYVRRNRVNRALVGATVTTSYGLSVTTGQSGYWRIDNALVGSFDLTVSMPTYNDSVLTDLYVEPSDTVQLNVLLLRPHFRISHRQAHIEAQQDDTTEFVIRIDNNGDGILDWSAEKRIITEGDWEPWDCRQVIWAGEAVDNDRLQGVVFGNDYFYVAGADLRGPNMIYVLDRQGNYQSEFEQCGQARLGMRDLAWDGQLMWGSGERTVYGFTTEGELVESFEGPFNNNVSLAWDIENELLWISGSDSIIAGYNRNGERVTEIDLDMRSFSISGLAYWVNDPDDHPLYIYSERQERQFVHKVNPETADMIFVKELEPYLGAMGGHPRGVFISDTYDLFSRVLITSVSDNGHGNGDRIEVWHLSDFDNWIRIDPDHSQILPSECQYAALIFDTWHIQPAYYQGEVSIQHNAFGSSGVISVSLNVIWNDVNEDDQRCLSSEFAITGIYPNPFNNEAMLTYALPQNAEVAVSVYDIQGRIVKEIDSGLVSAGKNTIWVDAGGFPSGVYWVRLSADDQVRVVKAVCVR
ncbi:MAG: T9SS type A sorting domain-containing protein [Candidatus Hatepunaea meridiana]|nr:T9SS type A sorting domain-containing protein [Candidatus Hatepunaea meridiana]